MADHDGLHGSGYLCGKLCGFDQFGWDHIGVVVMKAVLVNHSQTSTLGYKLSDPESMYNHIRLGLMLINGSDLEWMDEQVNEFLPELTVQDRLLLRTNWRLVRARLVAEGYV